MKTNQEIAVLVLPIVLSLFIIRGSVQSNQSHTIIQKSDLSFPKKENGFVQEETKYRYVGIGKCASVCHNKEEMGFQYNIMKNGPHSQAFKILVSKKAESYARKANIAENPQESQTCLKCHTTGGDLDSSFFTATYKKEEGVTCEACHKHISDGKTYLPNEADCLQCHNNSIHKIHTFNFMEDSAKIAHPRPAEILPKDTSASQAQ